MNKLLFALSRVTFISPFVFCPLLCPFLLFFCFLFAFLLLVGNICQSTTKTGLS